MARVVLFKDIFDCSNTEEFTEDSGISIKDFIVKHELDDCDYSSLVEVYDPETNETSFVPLEDNKETLNLSIIVNGNSVDENYIIKSNDEVIINVLPANKVVQGIATIVAAVAIATVGVIALCTGVGAAVGVGLILSGLVMGASGAYLIYNGLHPNVKIENETREAERDANKISGISGSKNQALTGNAFPTVVGTVSATPFKIGDPYTEIIQSDLKSDKANASWVGSQSKTNILLDVGYAPVFVDDIKFDQLTFAKNKDKLLMGKLSGNDIESVWKKNNPVVEITQFGVAGKNKTRSIYKDAVIQEKKDDCYLIYCYDKAYKDVEDTKNVVTWQGGTFPTGLRNKPVHFSAGIPWKVVVGINIPQGLYRKEESETYTKIPLNIAVQWRPHYKFMDKYGYDAEKLDGADSVYERDDFPAEKHIRTHMYTEKRYFGWRNFDNSLGNVVPKIKYTNSQQYFKNYKVGNKPALVDGYYGYYRSTTEGVLEGDFVPVRKKLSLQECKDALYNSFLTSYGTKKSSFYFGTEEYDYTGGSAVQDEREYYWNPTGITTHYCPKGLLLTELPFGAYPTESHTVSHVTRVYKYITYGKYVEVKSNDKRTKEEKAEAFADRTYKSYYEKQDAIWCKNENISNYSNPDSVSAIEVRLNKGLSDGTSTSSNPVWHGVDCFAFGRYSTGVWGYNKISGEKEPSLTTSRLNSGDKYTSSEKNTGPKDEMKFEIEAYLSQEDILDIINRNPASNIVGSPLMHPELAGMTDSTIDGIEIRVVRLTPNYVDKNSVKYSDIVKFDYIKTFPIDKQKLIEDIDYVEKGKRYAKINCDKATFDIDQEYDENGNLVKDISAEMIEDGSSRWYNWNIEDYKAEPMYSSDLNKLCTIGIQAEPDTLGVLDKSFDKINVTAHAITPALKKGYIRYWSIRPWTNTKDEKQLSYFYKDSYGDVDVNNVSTYQQTANEYGWLRPDRDVSFNEDKADAVKFYSDSTGREDYYVIKDKPWDTQFFPQIVDATYGLEPITDGTGAIVLDNEGHPKVDLCKTGSTWPDYIREEMMRNVKNNFYFASDAFLKTFTEQNAISQLLGFMCGYALGKDAYTYNSTNSNMSITRWYEGDGKYEPEGKYFMFNTFLSEPKYMGGNPSPGSATLKSKWLEVPKSIYDQFDRQSSYDANNPGWSYSLRDTTGKFNMLSVREAYEYTDKISVGNSGPLKYMYNKYIYQQRKVSVWMQSILVAARAYWFYDEMGRIEIHNDKPLKNPVLLLTDENVINSSNTRTFQKTSAGFHIIFQDESNGGKNGDLYILRSGQTRLNHTRDIKDLQLEGVTNRDQAKALGQFLLAQSIVRREVWTKKLNRLGSGLALGSLVELQGSSLKIGTDHSARILKLIEDDKYIYGFIIDNVYEYKAEYERDGTNKQGCSLMQFSNTEEKRVVTVRFANRTQQKNGITVTQNRVKTLYKNLKGETNLVLFEKRVVKESNLLETPSDIDGISAVTEFHLKEGDVVAFGYVGKITSKALVGSITPDDKGHFSVMFYPYYDEIYECDNGNYPAYNTNITRKAVDDSIPPTQKDVTTEIDAHIERINTKVDDALTEASESIKATEGIVQSDVQKMINDAKADTATAVADANRAKDEALKAKNGADTAAKKANTATKEANDAANTANAAAGSVDESKKKAEDAANAANTAANTINAKPKPFKEVKIHACEDYIELDAIVDKSASGASTTAAKWEISRDRGSTYTELETDALSTLYRYDRVNLKEYPEVSSLANYRFRVTPLSANRTAGSVFKANSSSNLRVDTTGYGTWKPSSDWALSVLTEGRKVILSVREVKKDGLIHYGKPKFFIQVRDGTFDKKDDLSEYSLPDDYKPDGRYDTNATTGERTWTNFWNKPRLYTEGPVQDRFNGVSSDGSISVTIDSSVKNKAGWFSYKDDYTLAEGHSQSGAYVENSVILEGENTNLVLMAPINGYADDPVISRRGLPSVRRLSYRLTVATEAYYDGELSYGANYEYLSSRYVTASIYPQPEETRPLPVSSVSAKVQPNGILLNCSLASRLDGKHPEYVSYPEASYYEWSIYWDAKKEGTYETYPLTNYKGDTELFLFNENGFKKQSPSSSRFKNWKVKVTPVSEYGVKGNTVETSVAYSLGTWLPPTLSASEAKATAHKEGVDLSIKAPSPVGYSTIDAYEWQVTYEKNKPANERTWFNFDKSNTFNAGNPNESEVTYHFDRYGTQKGPLPHFYEPLSDNWESQRQKFTSCYIFRFPEAETIEKYLGFRCRARSTTGVYGEYTDLIPVNTSAYGTWMPPPVDLRVIVDGRNVTISSTQTTRVKFNINTPEYTDTRTRDYYGKTRFRYRIKDTSYKEPRWNQSGVINQAADYITKDGGYIRDYNYYDSNGNILGVCTGTGTQFKMNDGTIKEWFDVVETDKSKGYKAPWYHGIRPVNQLDIEEYVEPGKTALVHRDPFSSWFDYCMPSWDNSCYETEASSVMTVLPLNGQSDDPVKSRRKSGKLTERTYEIHVTSINETYGWRQNDYVLFPYATQKVTVRPTDLRDAIRATDADIKSNTAIFRKLMAMITTTGLVKGQTGDSPDKWSNFWALTDIVDSDMNPDSSTPNKVLTHKGSFRVGGKDQYIEVKPTSFDEYGEPTDYSVTVKAGNIIFEKTETTPEGGVYIYSTNVEKSNFRLSLDPTGITMQKKDSNGEWNLAGKMSIDENGNCILSNSDEPIEEGIYIGKPEYSCASINDMKPFTNMQVYSGSDFPPREVCLSSCDSKQNVVKISSSLGMNSITFNLSEFENISPVYYNEQKNSQFCYTELINGMSINNYSSCMDKLEWGKKIHSAAGIYPFLLD